MKKKITIGIVAHVDAGKTTLSEALLYESGVRKELGRVDRKNTLLDQMEVERDRKITVFSKQASFPLGEGMEVTLLDTPGHVDFSAEMERTLSVLDYAILVISGKDGIQAHTKTLWHLLEEYRVPIFFFVNKMDQEGTNLEQILSKLQEEFSSNILPLTGEDRRKEDVVESMALCEESMMEEYLSMGEVSVESIQDAVAERKLFPLFYGSALKLEGVEEFMEGLRLFTKDFYQGRQEAPLGGRVFKITHEKGVRLTHVKILDGILRPRMNLGKEKITQIRKYQGPSFTSVEEALPGDVVTLLGCNETLPGAGFGSLEQAVVGKLVPVLSYRMIFPAGVSNEEMYQKLLVLSEEDPTLGITWNERYRYIEVSLMGEVQTEILTGMIKERFDVDVSFGEGNVLYQETIGESTYGVGHFEPLRHYAEVHLRMEPLPPGSGLVIEADVSEDILAKNWQRLVLTHIGERRHRGVLTGSPLTDVKITLVNGRAHQKHTEGGDFRQATYRAIRQGLMMARDMGHCKLLEPYYAFVIRLPQENLGRLLGDLDGMKAKFDAPVIEGEEALVTGKAPVITIGNYRKEMITYTKGRGSVVLTLDGFFECHNPEEVMEKFSYDPMGDVRNPADSVFCSHGVGSTIRYDEVMDYMHLPKVSGKRIDVKDPEYQKELEEKMMRDAYLAAMRAGSETHARYATESYSDSKELQEIFARTYGNSGKPATKEARTYGDQKSMDAYYERKFEKSTERFLKQQGTSDRETYVLFDGYNVLHANPDTEELMEENLEAARNLLIDVVGNYQAYRKVHAIVVFDAYLVKNNPGEVLRTKGVDVVYTKEAQTADAYIERAVHEIKKEHDTMVVTSDGLEQVIIRGAGCQLMSSREFWEDVTLVGESIKEHLKQRMEKEETRNYLLDHADEKLRESLEAIRLGDQKE